MNTIKQILSWPIVDGWSTEPKTERKIKLGYGVTLGDGVKLGNWVTLGDGVILPLVNIHGYTANPYSPKTIRIGCEIRTIQVWRTKLKAIMRAHGIGLEHEQTIRGQINWLAKCFDVYPNAMTKK